MLLYAKVTKNEISCTYTRHILDFFSIFADVKVKKVYEIFLMYDHLSCDDDVGYCARTSTEFELCAGISRRVQSKERYATGFNKVGALCPIYFGMEPVD